jgi:hypothetical protein
MDIKNKLSTLWIVVMFNMVFADILSFMLPDFLTSLIDGETDILITQELLLIFAIFLEIPILMIFFSRVLEYKVNRLLNMVASFITILFVIGGGSLTCHYLFFASVEVVCLLYIMWYAFTWKGNL